jgi:D-glycero-beta-D-manno-heptose 1-phosphate adenylyltransferase
VNREPSSYGIPGFERKICPPEGLSAAIAALPRPLVFTNGVFDILHRGHVTYLAQARALGASLVLALNADASVRRLGKGDDRPVNTLADRASVAAALEPVSLVTWFDEDTPLARILEVKPDVLVKGGDWKVDDIVGAAEVKSWGGSVHSIPFEHERSTTALLQKIRKP